MPITMPKCWWPVAAVLLLLLLLSAGRFANAQEPTSLFARAGAFPAIFADPAVAVHRGQLFVVGLNSGSASSYQSDDDGRRWSEMSAQPANRMAFQGARMITFQLAFHSVPSLVVTGGLVLLPQFQMVSDTMFLLDGNAAAWTVLSPSTSYPNRHSHGFVSARSSSSNAERLYVFGGGRLDSIGNDVWSADDAVSKWQEVTASAPWAPRYNFAFATVADRSRVIIAGGCCDFDRGYDFWGDAWISNVGLTSWTPLPPPSFSARQYFSMINVQHNLYVLGGESAQGVLNDVWVSSDEGRSWLLVTSDAGFHPRRGHAVAVRGREVVVIGGASGWVNFDDVWVATLP